MMKIYNKVGRTLSTLLAASTFYFTQPIKLNATIPENEIITYSEQKDTSNVKGEELETLYVVPNKDITDLNSETKPQIKEKINLGEGVVYPKPITLSYSTKDLSLSKEDKENEFDELNEFEKKTIANALKSCFKNYINLISEGSDSEGKNKISTLGAFQNNSKFMNKPFEYGLMLNLGLDMFKKNHSDFQIGAGTYIGLDNHIIPVSCDFNSENDKKEIQNENYAQTTQEREDGISRSDNYSLDSLETKIDGINNHFGFGYVKNFKEENLEIAWGYGNSKNIYSEKLVQKTKDIETILDSSRIEDNGIPITINTDLRSETNTQTENEINNNVLYQNFSLNLKKQINQFLNGLNIKYQIIDNKTRNYLSIDTENKTTGTTIVNINDDPNGNTIIPINSTSQTYSQYADSSIQKTSGIKIGYSLETILSKNKNLLTSIGYNSIEKTFNGGIGFGGQFYNSKLDKQFVGGLGIEGDKNNLGIEGYLFMDNGKGKNKNSEKGDYTQSIIKNYNQQVKNIEGGDILSEKQKEHALEMSKIELMQGLGLKGENYGFLIKYQKLGENSPVFSVEGIYANEEYFIGAKVGTDYLGASFGLPKKEFSPSFKLGYIHPRDNQNNLKSAIKFGGSIKF